MRDLRHMTVAGLAACAVVLSSTAGWAQVACAPRSKIVAALNRQYKETPVGIGLASPERVLELYVSDAGTWTLLLTGPGGNSCVIGTGQNWETMPVLAKGDAI